MSEDYYKILEVEKNATQEQIKLAFREKIKTAHPDVGGSEELAKKLNEAYSVLSDEEKRKQYDNPRQPHQSMPHGFSPFGGMPPDIFNLFMGGNGGQFHFQQNGNQGQFKQIIQVESEMSLITMLAGGNVIVNLPDGRALNVGIPPNTEPGKTFTIQIKEEKNLIVKLIMKLKLPILTTEQIVKIKDVIG